MTDLFTPFVLNGLSLPNRIVISPMTRTRATDDDVPTNLMRADLLLAADPPMLAIY